MRISDWSSDVCSSDLSARWRNVKYTSIIVESAYDVIYETNIAVAGRRRWGPQPNAMPSIGEDRSMPMSRLRCAVRTGITAEVALCAGAAAAAPHYSSEIRRSEAHTSNPSH